MTLSINGTTYRVADPSKVLNGARALVETTRPSQSFEASTVQRSWKVWGPLGNSRAGWNEDLGIDYCDNLDHRYDWLLTSTAKRNALTLTSISEFAYGVPISDVTKTNWSEGAGDGDGDAFDELDEGIESGTVDDATTYWTTTATGFANRIECNITSMTDPTVNTGFTVRFRVRVGTASERLVPMLLEGSNARFSTIVTPSAADTWITIAAVIPESTAALFSDFTNLELGIYKLEGTSALDVSTAELELPNTKFGDVSTLDWSLGYEYAHRGAFATQIATGTMTEVENNDRTNQITDTVPEWQSQGLLAFGAEKVVEARTAATSSSTTYSAISSVDATKMAVGSDRLWISDAGLTTVADKGKAKYTTNGGALTLANLSNPFNVADPGSEITGLYTQTAYAMVGHDRGVNSFTSSGKAVRLLEALKQFPSSANAESGDTEWGWTYVTSKLGLFAISIDLGITNPVGPGEGFLGQGFEGPVDGYPTEVKAFKDSIWVAYLNPDGTTYIFRGTWTPDTAGSGRPAWYNFRKLSSLECHAIGGFERDNPTLIVGEDENVAWYTLSTRGREIADSNYEFDTGGGTALLSTLMLPEGAKGNLRYGKFQTENCGASDTWQLAVDVDDASSFIDVGSAITTNGMQTVRPVSGGAPLGTVSFNSIKPRLTQVASSESAPPQIRGELTLAFDLRPDQVRDVTVMVEWNSASDYANLQALAGEDTLTPVAVRLPSDQEREVNTDRYCYIRKVTMQDRESADDRVMRIELTMWDTA